MPVSRNLSLPSSIETRSSKKRPDLHDLKHCASMSRSAQNNNSNNNNGVLDDDKESKTTRSTLSQPCLSQVINVGATSIFPHLFLGSQKDVVDEEMLRENNISNVLNVSCNCARPLHLDDDHFRRIAVLDNYKEKITPYLDEAVDFIEAARKKNERVLVHCLAGVSRSATVAIAYVMYHLRLNFDEAYSFVKEKRPTISPNFNFLGQLMEFQKKLHDRGHMAHPRTESIITGTRHEKVTTDIIPPSIKVMQPSESNTTNNNGPGTSSRRRKAFVLENLSSMNCSNHHDGAASISSDFNKTRHHVYNSVSPGGAGVLLDLHVSVPPTELHSRRLGSDGVEDDVDDAAPHSAMLTIPGMTHKSNSLPRSFPGFALDNRKPAGVRPGDVALDLRRGGMPLKRNAAFRSFTAPTTPEVLRVGINKVETHHEMMMHQNDVEMTQAEETSSQQPYQLPQPLSQSRTRCHVEQINVNTPPSVLDQRQDYSVAQTRTDEFVSRKTRSPKVLKKSFNLNLRPSYGYQAFLTTKQESNNAYQAAMPSRSRPTQDITSHALRVAQDNSKLHCESPGSNAMSALTLYSPGLSNEDPMERLAKSGVRSNLKDEREFPQTSRLSPSSDGTLPGRSSSTSTSSFSKTAAIVSPKPFTLAAGTELKPRWRNRRSVKRDEKSATRLTSSSAGSNSATNQTSTSSKTINRLNLSIISCS